MINFRTINNFQANSSQLFDVKRSEAIIISNKEQNINSSISSLGLQSAEMTNLVT